MISFLGAVIHHSVACATFRANGRGLPTTPTKAFCLLLFFAFLLHVLRISLLAQPYSSLGFLVSSAAFLFPLLAPLGLRTNDKWIATSIYAASTIGAGLGVGIIELMTGQDLKVISWTWSIAAWWVAFGRALVTPEKN